MLSYPDFIELCNQAGIKIADASMNIGRELSYRSAPDRIIVIHFIQSDFPETWKKTLYGILQLVSDWIFVNRHGEFKARNFSENELENLLELLIEIHPKVERECDDHYLVSRNGKIIISYNHHMMEEGMIIYLNDIQFTNSVLIKLNEMGSEIELISKHNG